jgi:hypothetical protein
MVTNYIGFNRNNNLVYKIVSKISENQNYNLEGNSSYENLTRRIIKYIYDENQIDNSISDNTKISCSTPVVYTENINNVITSSHITSLANKFSSTSIGKIKKYTLVISPNSAFEIWNKNEHMSLPTQQLFGSANLTNLINETNLTNKPIENKNKIINENIEPLIKKMRVET